jgi:hypothetical protein
MDLREEPKMETSVGRRLGGSGNDASGFLMLARPAVMLRIEGAAMLAGSVLLY